MRKKLDIDLNYKMPLLILFPLHFGLADVLSS